MNRKHFIGIVLIFISFISFSQEFEYSLSDDSLVNEYASMRRVYNATRTEMQPRIDGNLDDACWQEIGTWQGNFIQQQPEQAQAPSQQTEFKILYDNTYLYIALKCYDNQPEKIRSVLGRRDEIYGDVAGIALDSYYDKQTAFEFDVTAAGQKIDLMHLGEYQWDYNWDAVWDGKASVGDSAWYTEMRIPFSQLRYADVQEQIWGLHVWRWIDRLNEEDQWKLVPIDAPAMVYIFGELRGIKDIPNKRNFELLPYAKTKYISDARNNWKHGIGLDGKIGLASNFTLDYTVNPDFGQVEADPSVLNLTSYEVFYDEKRPFFLEGNNILDYGLQSDLLFYSRRIGQTSGQDEIPEEYESLIIGPREVEYPEEVSILNAVKLTGKTKSGFSLGVINSMTARENTTYYWGNNSKLSIPAEPFTNYFIGRAKQDFNDGNTILGGMVTSTIRNIKDEHLEYLPDNSTVAGLDFQHNWKNRKYFIDLKSFFSKVNGTEEAITSLQLDTRHLFQREDASHLNFDPEKTQLQGWGGEISGGKRSGKLTLVGELQWRSPEVELNDVGYMRQADYITEQIDAVYRVNEPKGILQSYYVNLDHEHNWSYGGEDLGGVVGSRVRFQFSNLWKLDLLADRVYDEVDTRQLRGGPSLQIGGNTSAEVFLQTNTSKDLFFGAGTEFVRWDDGISKSKDFTFHAQWLISNRLNISSRTTYIDETDFNQYVLQVPFMGDNSGYVVGEIDRNTIYTTLRAEFFLTPELSFQYYGSPYASAGKYKNYRAISNSLANNIEDRYKPLFVNSGGDVVDQEGNFYFDSRFFSPDFNFQEFRSNFVARWEYKTGSTIYFVWTNNRSRYESEHDPSILNSLKGITSVAAQNAFMIKISYWFTL